MRDVLDLYRRWQAEGVSVGRAVVIRTLGSVPRPVGAALLLAADGRLAGSVSGGCVEGAAAEEIERARRNGGATVVRYGIGDDQAWSVGLACGGTIDVLIEPEVPPEVVEAAAGDEGTVVIAPLPAQASLDSRPRLVFHAQGGLCGSTGDEVVDAGLVAAATDALARGASISVGVGGREYFLETFARRARLVIVGATEVARSLVTLATALGYETIVVDGRPAFALDERFPDADALIVGWLDEVAAQIDLRPTDAVAVLSHDPKFDEPAIVEALHRGCRYVGAIGSRKVQAERRVRLHDAGVSAVALARLHGPIGLDLGGRAPAEIALAVMAEIVAARYGATGEPLAEPSLARTAV